MLSPEQEVGLSVIWDSIFHTWNTFPSLLLGNLDRCHVCTRSRTIKNSIAGPALTGSSTNSWDESFGLSYGRVSVEKDAMWSVSHALVGKSHCRHGFRSKAKAKLSKEENHISFKK